MPKTQLYKDVFKDVMSFIRRYVVTNVSLSQSFSNERDFQMNLAMYLARPIHGYNNIHLEYPVVLSGYSNYAYVDIVVERGGEYVPIELKFHLRQRIHNMIFGNTISNPFIVQRGAYDNSCYDFWKDVKRLQDITTQYSSSVKSGLAVFLTDDKNYWTPKSPSINYYQFRLDSNNTNQQRFWNKPSPAKSRPNFCLNPNFTPTWFPSSPKGGSAAFIVEVV